MPGSHDPSVAASDSPPWLSKFECAFLGAVRIQLSKGHKDFSRKKSSLYTVKIHLSHVRSISLLALFLVFAD